jgi:hypothetical protein
VIKLRTETRRTNKGDYKVLAFLTYNKQVREFVLAREVETRALAEFGRKNVDRALTEMLYINLVTLEKASDEGIELSEVFSATSDPGPPEQQG